jgi:hypothetical protein
MFDTPQPIAARSSLPVILIPQLREKDLTYEAEISLGNKRDLCPREGSLSSVGVTEFTRGRP